MGHLHQLVFQAHKSKHLVDAVVDLVVVFPARSLQHKAEVLPYGAVVEELEILEDDSHLFAERRNVLAADGGDVASQHFSFLSVALLDIQLTIERL